MAASITVTATPSLTIVGLNASTITAIGGFGIQTVRQRVSRHINADDAPALPYSPKGPIYVPIFGVGEIQRGKRQGQRRIKTNLGGRFGFNKRDLKRMGVDFTGQRSIRYENYAEFKKALGKSGERDLQLTGRMLNAITIVNQTPTSVSIGFTRQQEAKKAAGNQKRDPWFLFSPNDQALIRTQAEKTIGFASNPQTK